MYKAIRHLVNVPDLQPYMQNPSFSKDDLELFIDDLNSTLEFSKYLLQTKFTDQKQERMIHHMNSLKSNFFHQSIKSKLGLGSQLDQQSSLSQSYHNLIKQGVKMPSASQMSTFSSQKNFMAKTVN